MIQTHYVVKDELYWDLKKIAYEKGIKMYQIFAEATKDYIDKNRDLLKQKVGVIN